VKEAVVAEEAAAAAKTAEDAAAKLAQEAQDAAAKLAQEAEDAAAKLASEAQEAAENAADAVTDALKIENFDLGAVSQLVDGSGLSGVEKLSLKGALESAKDDPELLKTLLKQVQSALAQ
ncbi:MAG: hypothetical protein KUG69_13565, partial [Marinosulfonomonas sp.]|nr:hypothetical protein [Marinosulfonomonas sp.]